MRRAPSTAALLTAVLLLLLSPVLGVLAADAAPVRPSVTALHPETAGTEGPAKTEGTTKTEGTAPRAADHRDHVSPAACVLQAGPRSEPHRDRPAAPGHPAAATVPGTAVPAPGPGRAPPPGGTAPTASGRPVPDRDRAPPASSGTRHP
ncbi:hypothetical protein [Streptomyces sp. PsTaAH-124]|uniref:hypothetical protein n=1 Tax=Streptomyces sp. PsTaAH-124 TaxID=1157638 RepID=UPI00036563EF|nr:hypothetical protein [Streptomyces sp. PsTaAH-124]